MKKDAQLDAGRIDTRMLIGLLTGRTNEAVSAMKVQANKNGASGRRMRLGAMIGPEHNRGQRERKNAHTCDEMQHTFA